MKARVMATKPKAPDSARSRQLRAVAAVMQALADRGVFRQFESRPLSGGRAGFRFVWLADHEFTMAHDPARRTLTFVKLLPGIPARSEMDRALREFVRGRAARALPAHRRLDPRRAQASLVNRGGALSLVVRFSDSGADYAARKSVELVNEIFFAFLYPKRHDYMVAHFNAPSE